MHMQAVHRALIGCVILGVAGCSVINPPPLQLAEMVPRSSGLEFRASGKTCTMGSMEGRKEKGEFFFYITTADLQQITTESIKQSGLFSSVYTSAQRKSDYTLTAQILGQPWEGHSELSVALYVRYQLKCNRTGITVLDKRIHSRCTKTMSDATTAPTRIRLASEEAGRENVRKLMQELARLSL